VKTTTKTTLAIISAALVLPLSSTSYTYDRCVGVYYDGAFCKLDCYKNGQKSTFVWPLSEYDKAEKYRQKNCPGGGIGTGYGPPTEDRPLTDIDP
jgi:hypothetical protein